MAIMIVAKTVSFAYYTSRNWCSRQTYQCSVCPNWEPYMSDTPPATPTYLIKCSPVQ